MEWQQYLFSFQGRINRAKWWLGFAIQIGLMLAAGAVAAMLFVGKPILGAVGAAVFYIAMIWVGLAFGAKRLHDRDRSAWFLLVFWGVPMVLAALGVAAKLNGSDGVWMLCSLGQFAVAIWGLVELGCLRGTSGPNRFGHDPLGATMPVGAAGQVLRG